jgi:hypothetical protein
MYRNKKLLQSADGAPCLARFTAACTGQGDVCWRHSNEMQHGKATGIKAHDIFGFYGCRACEDYYSGGISRTEKRAIFLPAWHRSMIYAADNGFL